MAFLNQIYTTNFFAMSHVNIYSDMRKHHKRDMAHTEFECTMFRGINKDCGGRRGDLFLLDRSLINLMHLNMFNGNGGVSVKLESD